MSRTHFQQPGRVWSTQPFQEAGMVLRTVRRVSERAAFPQDSKFGNGPSRANRHRGTLPRSLLPVVFDNDLFVIRVSSQTMSLKRKSSAGAGSSHVLGKQSVGTSLQRSFPEISCHSPCWERFRHLIEVQRL